MATVTTELEVKQLLSSRLGTVASVASPSPHEVCVLFLLKCHLIEEAIPP